MLIIYNFGIQLYYFVVFVYSFFNAKAKQWIVGRNHLLKQIAATIDPADKHIWFHFSSLGEFEQGRPLLENIKKRHPDKKILLTFFSPSGYEIRKSTPLASYVFYLPLDTEPNAREFIRIIKPEFAVFTKYDYWYHYFNELHQKSIPLYVVSALFWRDMSFFKWYGSFQRGMLPLISRLFVQDEESKKLLAEIGVHQVTVSGDTRFDRVVENVLSPKHLPLISEFAGNSLIFIAGSTWPQDENYLALLPKLYPDWKFIIAPHEINEDKINTLKRLFAEYSILYSELNRASALNLKPQTLIIDNIGMLSSIYQYGSIAYIGGGFGIGIHNTLEAAAFKIPIIFGPNYQRFREARELIAEGGAFNIGNSDELKAIVAKLADAELRLQAGKYAGDYVVKNTGATETILKYLLP